MCNCCPPKYHLDLDAYLSIPVYHLGLIPIPTNFQLTFFFKNFKLQQTIIVTPLCIIAVPLINLDTGCGLKPFILVCNFYSNSDSTPITLHPLQPIPISHKPILLQIPLTSISRIYIPISESVTESAFESDYVIRIALGLLLGTIYSVSK